MNKKNNLKKIAFATVVVLATAVLIILSKDKNPADPKTAEIQTVRDSDIIIPVNSVTDTASFYPAEMKGTKLEVLAVKAPDGSIRTAFNTCQVCYSSGRGYYVQEDGVLICQNCGNRFSMDEVEVTRGGCNPVPITSEYKTVDEVNITISKEYLTQATVIFQNWR